MSNAIIQVDNGGVIIHKNVEKENINLEGNAEWFENPENFKQRLEEISGGRS